MDQALCLTLATALLATCSGCANYLDAKAGAPALQARVDAAQQRWQHEALRRDDLSGRAAGQDALLAQQQQRIAALQRELAQIDAALRNAPPEPSAAADRAAYARLASLQARRKTLEAELARLASQP